MTVCKECQKPRLGMPVCLVAVLRQKCESCETSRNDHKSAKSVQNDPKWKEKEKLYNVLINDDEFKFNVIVCVPCFQEFFDMNVGFSISSIFS